MVVEEKEQIIYQYTAKKLTLEQDSKSDANLRLNEILFPYSCMYMYVVVYLITSLCTKETVPAITV